VLVFTPHMLRALCSDGVVRVFTAAPERTAEEEVQKTYEAEVAASSIPAQIGDIKTDQLSGPEALLNPGRQL
jgi:phospholipase A-2-activating protein